MAYNIQFNSTNQKMDFTFENLQIVGNGSGGASNVYIGTEEPPESAEVWIDPEAALMPEEIPSISVEQTANGAVITAVSLDSVTTAEIKNGKDGSPGTAGKDGKDGKDGYTPVKGIDYFDGKDGSPGADGKDGADGYTPVKGTDYFTADDKAEMVSAVGASLPTETWTFILEDGSEITKEVLLK